MTARNGLGALVFVALLLVLDVSLGHGIARLREGMRAGGKAEADARRIVDHLQRDVFVFGSSRAHRHISPAILADALGRSVYNLGADGHGVLLIDMLAGMLLDRGTPSDLYILQLDAQDLCRGTMANDAWLAPFSSREPSVRAVLGHDLQDRVKLASSLYRQNSRALRLVWAGFGGPRLMSDGYAPVRGRLSAGDDWRAHVPAAAQACRQGGVRPWTAERLTATIRRARAAGIEVVVTIGPRLREPADVDAAERVARRRLEQIVSLTGAHFVPLDEASTPELLDPELYRDFSHLNQTGAEYYTRRLSAEIIARLPALAGAGS